MKKLLQYTALSMLVWGGFSLQSCVQAQGVKKVALTAPKGKAIATFGEGCFWHSAYVFEAVNGVDSAIAGYAGGHAKNPTYQSVCSETTGHAEAVLVYYDPKIVSYEELLNVFFLSQDPTTKDRQGNDVGSSYRSIILYQGAVEKSTAEASIKKYNASGRFRAPIVTEVKPLDAFYRAEQYHQKYVNHNPNQPYVQSVSLRDFADFKKQYKGKLKY